MAAASCSNPVTMKAAYPATFQLYGKTYDAVAWASVHPGGPLVIESATCLDSMVLERLFESSHRDPVRNLKSLGAYEIKRDSPKSISTIDEDERGPSSDAFFDAARDDVFRYLRTRYPGNPKGEGRTWALVKCVAAGLAWTLFIVGALVSRMAPILLSFVGGIVLITWGLIQFHDASHYAFGGGAEWNRWLTSSWGAIAYWPAWLWHRHHVELHHGCTGDYERDPDLRHGAPFMRKTSEAPKERYFGLSAMMQAGSMAVSPGMYLGQTIHYTTVRWGFRRALWKMHNLVPPPAAAQMPWWEVLLSSWLFVWILALIFRHGILQAIACTLAYFLGANLTYAANILPDHDTDTSHRNLATLDRTPKLASSWAAKQVAASANWAGTIWCFFFGGLNYQIEHHLFPRIHHTFYPEIAPIVAQCCKRFHVPYIHYDSFLAAATAVHRQIRHANADLLSTPHHCD